MERMAAGLGFADEDFQPPDLVFDEYRKQLPQDVADCITDIIKVGSVLGSATAYTTPSIRTHEIHRVQNNNEVTQQHPVVVLTHLSHQDMGEQLDLESQSFKSSNLQPGLKQQLWEFLQKLDLSTLPELG
jgi:hypothetical protein